VARKYAMMELNKEIKIKIENILDDPSENYQMEPPISASNSAVFLPR